MASRKIFFSYALCHLAVRGKPRVLDEKDYTTKATGVGLPATTVGHRGPQNLEPPSKENPELLKVV